MAAVPHNIDAEKSVLSAILTDNERLPEIMQVVSVEDFYASRHRLIYRTFTTLAAAKSSIDPITVTNDLRNRKALDDMGGVAYLMELQGLPGSVSQAPHHAALIKEASLLRSLDRLQKCDFSGKTSQEIADAMV